MYSTPFKKYVKDADTVHVCTLERVCVHTHVQYEQICVYNYICGICVYVTHMCVYLEGM